MTDLVIRGLGVDYATAGYVVHAIQDLDFEAGSGDLVLLLGPSGCGKTTLLSCLAGILTPTRGSIDVAGEDVTTLRGRDLADYRRHKVGVVFQAFNLVSSLTAEENVCVPLWSAGRSHRDARARAAEVLELVGMAERAGHRPAELSGGQQQRVAIARALVHDPPLLLADEPTAHLDYVQVEVVVRTLRTLAQPGRLVVVATHDARLAPIADQVLDFAGPSAHSTETVTVDLAPGEVLFAQGDGGDLVYVVESGEVELIRSEADGSVEVLDRAGAGRYFGELSPMLGFPRAATARASTAARVTGYPVAAFRSRVGMATPES